MWPGRARSAGRVRGSRRDRTVVHRSAAEMPVVVPWMASTEMVNAVRCDSVLLATMSGSWSWSRRCPSSGMQMTPLVWRIMNAIVSGVTFSAAMTRSPSFSRSASSTATTSSPRLIAAMAFSILVNGTTTSGLRSWSGEDQTLDVLGDDVRFEVHGIAGVANPERGHREGVRDEGDTEPVVGGVGHGEADAVDGDGSLLDDVAQERLGGADREAGGARGFGGAAGGPPDRGDLGLDEGAAR